MKLPCPQCSIGLNLGEEHRGKKVRCPKCDHVFVAVEMAPVVLLEPDPVVLTPHDEPELDIEKPAQGFDFNDTSKDDPEVVEDRKRRKRIRELTSGACKWMRVAGAVALGGGLLGSMLLFTVGFRAVVFGIGSSFALGTFFFDTSRCIPYRRRKWEVYTAIGICFVAALFSLAWGAHYCLLMILNFQAAVQNPRSTGLVLLIVALLLAPAVSFTTAGFATLFAMLKPEVLDNFRD